MHFTGLGETLNAFDSIQKVLSNTSIVGTNQIVNLSSSLSGYSDEAVKAAMVQAKLTHEQMEGILQSREYSDALLKSTLKQLDLEVSTQKVADAQKTSVTFVDKLKYAYSGLADTLGFTTAQLTIWLGVIAGAVAVAAVVKAYNEQQKELASTTKANAQETKSASKELENYTAQYGTLRKELLDTNTTEERQAEIKKELLAIQTDLNEKYGDEYGKINLVTDAYKNQTETPGYFYIIIQKPIG